MGDKNQPLPRVHGRGICICTSLSMAGSKHGGGDRIRRFATNLSLHGLAVYVVDRSIPQSLSAFVVDDDRYLEIKNGKTAVLDYPFFIRFLVPGLVKFLQHVINEWYHLLGRTLYSELSVSYFIDPCLVAKLFFVCKKERVDLIQFEFPTTAVSSFFVKKVLGIPLVYDAHNIESKRMSSYSSGVSRLSINIMKQMELVSLHISDLVFVVSKNDLQQMLSWKVTKDKIGLIPNSVDLQEFSPSVDGSEVRKRYDLNNKIVMIFHGALGYAPNREAIEVLLDRILPRILERNPSARLLLVGEDPPKRVYHRNVVVTGAVENLPAYIAAADLAVVPLLSGGGTRIKLLEYMACGKAIISTFNAAEGLDIENGIDILMTKDADTEFVDFIVKLIENPDLRERMGGNARDKVESFYNWRETAGRAVQYYDRLLQRGEID